MKFYEELEQLRKIKNQCLSEARGLEDQKQSELETTRMQIIEKYSELSKSKYKELGEHNDRIDSYCQMLAEYSFFSTRDIGNIIASLIRTFEGINYIYQDTYYDKKEFRRLAFDTEETEIRSRLRIIVAEEDKSNSYSDDSVDSLVKRGKAIILSTTETMDNQIPFYEANTNNHSLDQCIKFGKFAYVKEFIDELISYKIEKKSKYISFEELECLEIDFITSRVEQIEDNYRVVEEQQEEQMKQKLATDKENRQLRLRRILDKKKN